MVSERKGKRRPLPANLEAWVVARKRHRLSHAHVQMARELGMNPRKLGSKANHDREPWKAPLPIFIADLYLKRFGRERPAEVLTVEQVARRMDRKKAERKARSAAARHERAAGAEG